MMRLPVILAGVAAAVILMRITRRKPENLIENSIDGNKVKSFAAHTATLVKPEEDEPEEIIEVKRLKVPERLEAKYPGLKNIGTKAHVVQH